MDSDIDDVEHMLIIHLYKYMTVLSACLLDLPGNDQKYDLYWKETDLWILCLVYFDTYLICVICSLSIFNSL